MNRKRRTPDAVGSGLITAGGAQCAALPQRRLTGVWPVHCLPDHPEFHD